MGGYRIFDVRPGATVRLEGITISHGFVRGPATYGGGIQNRGTLTLDRVVVRENAARGPDAGSETLSGGTGFGGGIYSSGFRIELEYGLAGGTEVSYLQARVRNGRWELDARLPDGTLAGPAAREGTVNAHVLFTGYLPRRMRGEQRSYQVLPAP